MLLTQFISNSILFISGIIGLIRNQNDIILILMSIEIVLLGVNLNFLTSAVYLDDMYGQLFSLFILAIGASEAAVGLAIVILYYRVRGDIIHHQNPSLKN
jgi:NADH-quinone oxidoreductase subunit K